MTSIKQALTYVLTTRLIMLLIYGDLMKALCLFSLAVVAMGSGDITTQSIFCQCSGFFLQYGTETSGKILALIYHHLLTMTCCRLRCSCHCSTQCPTSVSSVETNPLRWLVSIPVLCVPGCSCPSKPHVWPCFPQPPLGLYVPRSVLLASSETILVSPGTPMGSSLFDCRHHPGPRSRNLCSCRV